MRQFLVTLEYDGTAFAGWQKQPGLRTVQGELEKALQGIAGARVDVTGAGRTDRGVHATGQAATFSLDKWKSSTQILGNALSAKLPGDVAVTRVWEVPAGFSARREGVSRSYRYTFLLSPVRSPLLERYAYRVEKMPDYPAMRKVAALFRGTHDFTAFSRETDGTKWPCRTVSRSILSRFGRYIFLDVESRGFLRHMVRNMAAAVLGVGLGMFGLAEVRRALKGGGKRLPLAMLPPHGLVLTGVKYQGLGRIRKGGRRRPDRRVK